MLMFRWAKLSRLQGPQYLGSLFLLLLRKQTQPTRNSQCGFTAAVSRIGAGKKLLGRFAAAANSTGSISRGGIELLHWVGLLPSLRFVDSQRIGCKEFLENQITSIQQEFVSAVNFDNFTATKYRKNLGVGLDSSSRSHVLNGTGYGLSPSTVSLKLFGLRYDVNGDPIPAMSLTPFVTISDEGTLAYLEKRSGRDWGGDLGNLQFVQDFVVIADMQNLRYPFAVRGGYRGKTYLKLIPLLLDETDVKSTSGLFVAFRKALELGVRVPCKHYVLVRADCNIFNRGFMYHLHPDLRIFEHSPQLLLISGCWHDFKKLTEKRIQPTSPPSLGLFYANCGLIFNFQLAPNCNGLCHF
jgi:hypothetical protein